MLEKSVIFLKDTSRLIAEDTQGVLYTKSNGFAICGTNISMDDNNAGKSLTSTIIYILNTYENLPVTQIGKSAFRKNNDITTVYIPINIEYMFYDAFGYCRNLENIYFEEGSHLFYIYSGSFYILKKLKYLRLPMTVTNIPIQHALGGNPNWKVLIYCGMTLFPNETFTIFNQTKNYCPETIYVRKNYPYENFGGCNNLVRVSQCSLNPPIICNTVRNINPFMSYSIIFSNIYIFMLA